MPIVHARCRCADVAIPPAGSSHRRLSPCSAATRPLPAPPRAAHLPFPRPPPFPPASSATAGAAGAKPAAAGGAGACFGCGPCSLSHSHAKCPSCRQLLQVMAWPKRFCRVPYPPSPFSNFRFTSPGGGGGNCPPGCRPSPWNLN